MVVLDGSRGCPTRHHQRRSIQAKDDSHVGRVLHHHQRGAPDANDRASLDCDDRATDHYDDRAANNHNNSAADDHHSTASTDYDNVSSTCACLSGSGGKLFTDDRVGQLLSCRRVLLGR